VTVVKKTGRALNKRERYSSGDAAGGVRMPKPVDEEKARLVREAREALSDYVSSQDEIFDAANALTRAMENRRALKRLWQRANDRVLNYTIRKRKAAR